MLFTSVFKPCIDCFCTQYSVMQKQTFCLLRIPCAHAKLSIAPMHAQVVQVNLQSGLLPTLNELISSECLPVALCHYLRHLYFNVVSLLHWSGYKTCVSGCVCWVLAHRTPAATSRCLGHVLQYIRNLPLSLHCLTAF